MHLGHFTFLYCQILNNLSRHTDWSHSVLGRTDWWDKKSFQSSYLSFTLNCASVYCFLGVYLILIIFLDNFQVYFRSTIFNHLLTFCWLVLTLTQSYGPKNKMLNNKKVVHKLNSHNNLMVKKRQKKSK